MNRCSPDVWAAAKAGSRLLRDRCIPHMLIGTAALAACGETVDVPDVDFLVERHPETYPDDDRWSVEKFAFSGASGGERERTIYDGENCSTWIDFVEADGWRREFLNRLEEAVSVDGVFVAPPALVWAIKARADRPKDREHAKKIGGAA